MSALARCRFGDRARPALRAARRGSCPGRIRSSQEKPSCGLRHDDDALRLLAQRGQHLALVIRRLRKHGVEREDERSSQAPARTTARTRRRLRRRSRTRVATGRRRRRGGPGALPRGRSHPVPPARPSPRHPCRCGLDASSTIAIAPTLLTPGTARSDVRTSNANVPIPHARGGYVEKMAVRTVSVRPFRQVSGVLALNRRTAWPGRGPW